MKMDDKIRVLLADDHPLVRVGIRTTLEQTNDIEVVGEATHGTEISPLCVELLPEVLLLDLSMPGLDPTITVAAIRAELPQIKIIILSAHNTPSHVRSMTDAQVDGFVLKDDAPEDVAQAIRAVMHNKVWYSQAVVQQMLTMQRAELVRGEVPLNLREQQILSLMIKGWNNREIAEELALAEQTVKNYLSNIYHALNVSSRSEAIVWAINHGCQQD